MDLKMLALGVSFVALDTKWNWICISSIRAFDLPVRMSSRGSTPRQGRCGFGGSGIISQDSRIPPSSLSSSGMESSFGVSIFGQKKY